jgi:dTDP-4-dehydrorhamnose 3,5-epimerase
MVEIDEPGAEVGLAMNRFQIDDLPLEGLKLVERIVLGDRRGFLARLFCAEELRAAGWQQPIAQINHTHTAIRGTVRGMHFQNPPHAEMKLVTCIRGSVWDVAVDLRVGSPTMLHWHAEELSSANHRALLIPEGFAHGFQALTEDVELVYVHSCAYVPASESGLHPQDPRLDVSWPLPVQGLSARDSSHPFIPPTFRGLPK